MKNKLNIQSERFHYCMTMEMVEWELFGIDKKPHGMASAFADYRYFKKRAKAFLRKIKNRLNEVVRNDETLRVLLAEGSA